MTPLSKITLLQIAHRCGYTITSMPEFHTLRGGTHIEGGGMLRYGEPCGPCMITVGHNAVVVDAQRMDLRVHLDGAFDLFIAHSDGPHND